MVLSLVTLSCTPSMPPLPTPYTGQNRLPVAILAPLSGELAPYGQTVRHAVELAFDEWNEHRNSGVFLEAIPEDTACDATLARRAAERVVNAGVRFIIGGICSEAAIPIASVADGSGALFIATSATHPLVTVDAGGNTRPLAFRAAFSYAQQGRAVSRFLLETLRLNRVVVVNHLGSPFAREVIAAFNESFTRHGGYARFITVAANQPSDFREHLDAQMMSDVQAVYVPDNYATMMRVQSALRQEGISRPILGSDWWNKHELQPDAMEDAYLVAHYSAQAANPITEGWIARYRAAFAVEPDTLAALAYDAAMVLVRGIEQSENTSPEIVARALSTMTYEGVTGNWRFDIHHDPLKHAFFLKVHNGMLQFAGTANLE